jgi:hypothetical protein
MKFYSVAQIGGMALVGLTMGLGAWTAQAQSRPPAAVPVPAAAGAAGTNDLVKIESRYLFIFDTSSAMKKRLPAIDQQIDSLLAGRLGSHLQDGDTIGIWTFSKDLRMGDMPLQRWSAQNSTIVADNIKTFIESQDYDKDTDFNALQPYLNGLISHSDRLIVFIFSDGDGQIVGTPYDERISNIFKKRKGDMRKARQPFVLVFTTQQGQFAGANLGEPPGGVAIPNFPPWPQPPTPTNLPPVVEEKPAPVIPPLIVIGSHVNPPPPVTPVAVNPPAPPPVYVPPPVAAPVPSSAPVAAVAPAAPAATAPVEPAPTPASVPAEAANVDITQPSPAPNAPTPAVVVPTNNAPSLSGGRANDGAGSNYKLLIGIVIGLLIAAGIMGLVLLARPRRRRGSLISDSMRLK